MNKTNFEFSIGSHVAYEDLIADIGFDNKLVAIISQEDGFENLKIEIYPPEEGGCWNFKFDEFENVIQKAKQRLWELLKISE